MTTPKEVIEFAKENDAVMVDLKFIDFLGTWQHDCPCWRNDRRDAGRRPHV